MNFVGIHFMMVLHLQRVCPIMDTSWLERWKTQLQDGLTKMAIMWIEDSAGIAMVSQW